MRKKAGDAIFKTATDALAGLFAKYPLGISMEIMEIMEVLSEISMFSMISMAQFRNS